jgi:hypothetical protein
MASRLAALTLLAFLLASQSTAKSPFPQGATLLQAKDLTALSDLRKQAEAHLNVTRNGLRYGNIVWRRRRCSSYVMSATSSSGLKTRPLGDVQAS